MIGRPQLKGQLFCLRVVVFAVCLSLSKCFADDTFFESRIRPLLVTHCIECHSDEHTEGGLSLESYEGWRDREVIVPRHPEQSVLLKAVRYEDDDLQMPPAGSDLPRLSAAQIRDLEQWIRDGAIDPRTAAEKPSGPTRRHRQFRITEQDLQHWAYQPLKLFGDPSDSRSATDPTKTQIGAGPDTQQPQTIDIAVTKIDQLHRDNLTAKNLSPSQLASPRELVRRAYFDLWGLPPTPEAVAKFEQNPSEQAWTTLIDELLASNHFGERWGRHWLDVVRYAESNGYERDGPKPQAFRYRDYVIRSFNADKPYDRFIVEQLAGDLLLKAEGLTPEQHPAEWRDAVIATGFYRLHVWDDEPDSSAAAEFDDLDDILVTTGVSILGLTIGCARCHDHKFDPISQADYYSLLDFLRDIDPYGLPKTGGGGRGTGQIEVYLCSDAELENWRTKQQRQIAALEQDLENLTPAEVAAHQQELEELKRQSPPFERALAVRPPVAEPKSTHILQRGDHQSPVALVTAEVPEIFRRLSDGIVQLPPVMGPPMLEPLPNARFDRLALARWMASPHRPLTARVIANRVWFHHFGSGIVPTVDDFGYTGLAPTNIELLDYLAAYLIDQQWSLKSLHRAIMKSQAYRMSSHLSSDNLHENTWKANSAIDPGNQFFWRQNLRRLDAESIRDSMLFYAGALSDKREGPSVYTELSAEIRETANPVSLSFWGQSPMEEQDCRSVFLVVKRSLKDPLLESFDFANSHSPVGQRPVTTVAPQALMLLNDAFVRKQAVRLVHRIQQSNASADQQLSDLWQIVFQRLPTAHERQLAADFLHDTNSPEEPTIPELWIALARALLNSNEALFVD